MSGMQHAKLENGKAECHAYDNRDDDAKASETYTLFHMSSKMCRSLN